MSIYEKNLTEDLRLRLSPSDMDFLRDLSIKRQISVSEVLRSMISEYRRSLETIETLNKAIALINQGNGDKLFNGNTKTDIND